MGRFFKWIGGLAIVALLALAAGYVALTTGMFEMPLAEIEAKYQLPESRWIDIDGIRVHYTDQSPPNVQNAPAVVLAHASFMSLHSWESLTKALLANGYRVIRMDFMSLGLTSSDTKGINNQERNIQILKEVPERLGVSKYHLVGTSSGGQTAFIHAGRNPERVERFVLINSGGMPRTAQSNPNRPRGSFIHQFITANYRSYDQWKSDLENNMPSLRPIPPALIERVHDMNRREGLRPIAAEYLRNFKTGDTAAYLAQVKAPTMILQGMANPTLVHTEAEVQSYWMTGAPSIIRKYPKLGHYPYMESPAEVEADILAFFSGALDGELRQTMRAPVVAQAGMPATESAPAVPATTVDETTPPVSEPTMEPTTVTPPVASPPATPN
jgi:pimeloyl-ACP methyl ester carboxylesterase